MTLILAIYKLFVIYQLSLFYSTEIQNFLTDEECDHFISAAKTEGLFSSHTEKMNDKQNDGRFQLIDSNSDKQLSIDEVSIMINACAWTHVHM